MQNWHNLCKNREKSIINIIYAIYDFLWIFPPLPCSDTEMCHWGNKKNIYNDYRAKKCWNAIIYINYHNYVFFLIFCTNYLILHKLQRKYQHNYVYIQKLQILFFNIKKKMSNFVQDIMSCGWLKVIAKIDTIPNVSIVVDC